MADDITDAPSLEVVLSDHEQFQHSDTAAQALDDDIVHIESTLKPDNSDSRKVQTPEGERHSVESRGNVADISSIKPDMCESHLGDIISQHAQVEQHDNIGPKTVSTIQDKINEEKILPEIAVTQNEIQKQDVENDLPPLIKNANSQSALKESQKPHQPVLKENSRNDAHSVQKKGNEENDTKEKSNRNHGDTCTSEPNYTSSCGDAQIGSTLEVKMAHLKHQIESNDSCVKNDTRGNEACSIIDPSGPELAEAGRVFSPDGQTAAVAHNSNIKHHETKLPQANLDSAKTGDRISIDTVNKGKTVIINQPVCPMSKTDNVTNSSLSTNPQHQTASMGVAASSNWVSFEDENNTLSSSRVKTASPTRSKQEASGKEGWVEFETSPSVPEHAIIPQLTGGSSVYSVDRVCDDQQSDITMSVPSSRGSLSESRDNVHISHEYLPLGSSPSPQPRSKGNVSSWVQFPENSQVSPRQMHSPPLHLPLSSPPRVHSRSSTESPISSMSTPSHVDSQVNQRQETPKIGSHQTGVRRTGWISFDEPDSSTQISPGKVISDDRSTTSTPFQTLSEKEATEKRLQLQQLQQSIALQQQQQIQSRQQQQPVIIPFLHPHQPQVSLQTAPQQALAPDPSLSFPPSTSTPVPGNPFREEMLRQQQRAVSPFNPFQSNVPQTPSTPGGTVSAMWGESPITPGTVTAMWEEFEETSAAVPSVQKSPGNPFTVMTLENTNLYNAQHQLAAEPLTGATAGDIPASHLQRVKVTASAIPLKEQAQLFLAQNASSDQPPIISTSSSTPSQSTPTATQPFQRYTKASKQVTIRASGKRPKVDKTQKDEVVIDNTPFVDEFPRERCDLTVGWPMMLRCPDKKRVAGSRYWKPVRVKLIEGNVIQLFDSENSLQPFRELPLQCNYELGDRKLQAYDTQGKIHTLKLLYVSYSEKRRYNTRTPYEKVMHVNQLLKLGSTDYNTFRSFIFTISEYLMKLPSFRDRGISYKQDAIGVIVSDDYHCRIKFNGELQKQSINVDLTMLAFLSDMPECSIALNDIQVKGIEVVSRRDIIPNKTNQWIKLENMELHKCANKNVFVESRFVEFSPLDACRFCLMRFQTRPRQNMELPLHVKVTVNGEGAFLELRVDLLLPARPGRRDPTQFTCENIMVRIPIPETWIKYFRRERRLGFYSVKSAHGKPDHIKQGSLNPRLLEVSTGSAKYEHAYKSIVWRIEKLPEKATVFSASHILMCRIHLSSHREVPRTPQGDVEVEFTMPQTTASRSTVRSLAVASDKPLEKRIRYMAHYENFVEIENKVVLHMLDGEEEGPGQCYQQ